MQGMTFAMLLIFVLPNSMAVRHKLKNPYELFPSLCSPCRIFYEHCRKICKHCGNSRCCISLFLLVDRRWLIGKGKIPSKSPFLPISSKISYVFTGCVVDAFCGVFGRIENLRMFSEILCGKQSCLLLPFYVFGKAVVNG